MTGIELLRELANATDCSVWACTDEIYCESHGLDGSKNFGGRMRDALNDIADQIERETIPREPGDGHVGTETLHAMALVLLDDWERDAIAWVREHGGLSHVKDIYNDFRAVVECLGVEWSESELHGLMDALDRRLMPDGGWPRYEDGEMVLVGSDFADGLGETHTVTSIEFFEGCVELHWNPDEPGEFEWFHPGERVKRPAPKALAGDA